jgi:hypothetical protein
LYVVVVVVEDDVLDVAFDDVDTTADKKGHEYCNSKYSAIWKKN